MSIRRSLAFSFLEKYASTAINIGATLVIARLLAPEEIGVFSVGAAVVGVMHTLRDFGVTNYLIQEREISRDKRLPWRFGHRLESRTGSVINALVAVVWEKYAC